MAAPQGIPQQPGVTQHLMIASPQQYPQMSPPAYMPTTQPIGSTPPQAFMVTNNQQMPSAPVSVPSGNLAPSSGDPGASLGNTQQVAESTSPAPATAEPVVSGQVAENPQNWQTFQ